MMGSGNALKFLGSTHMPKAKTSKTHPAAVLRVRRGWTVQDLIDRSQLSRGTIQNVESGRDYYASTLTRLSEVFEVRPGVILGTEPLPEEVSSAEDAAEEWADSQGSE